MRRWFTWPKAVLYFIVIVLLAAWYVPKISAARYREPIRNALESALGRKVEIGQVQFQLLPMPGFTIDHVIIGEDPAIGPEPTAYVDMLRARPRLTALLGGPLEFASVDLEDTSVNLTRVGNGQGGIHWNFSSLMKPKLLAAFPSIHMAGGRVNFKFGDTKSVFYLLKTDVDLWPPDRSDGAWTLRVRAEPARTDRPARGFGSFVARGVWRQRDGALTLDVKLEKSELGDMITLVEGSESPLHGHIWGDAHLAGPLSRVGLAGRMTIDDIHGWNQNPPPGAGALPFAVSGFINLPGQMVELRALSALRQSPFDLRYRVTDYLARPRWAVTGIFNQTPLAPLPGIGRSLGWHVPGDLTFNGTAQGAVGYSMPDGVVRMDGAVRIVNPVIGISGAQPLKVSDADLQFTDSSVTLTPTTIVNAANETAMVTGTFDVSSGQVEASLASGGMSIASMRRPMAVFHAPLLAQATSGTWNGNVRYASGAWGGAVRVSDADVPFEAFNQPLHVVSADTEFDETGIYMRRLNVSMGGITVQGEYRYLLGAERPHRFKLVIPRADGGNVEKLLMPALHRGTFLNYAFNFGRVPEPDWMRDMHADGTVQVGSLDLGGKTFTRLKTRVVWDGDEVKLAGLQAQLADAVFAGSAVADLSQRQPRYQVSGKFTGLSWKTGTIDVEGDANTSGTGDDLFSNLSARGALRARNIGVSSRDSREAVNGCFDWSGDLRNSKLKLSQLAVTSGGNTYLGDAETQSNGKLLFNVTDGSKSIRSTLNLLGP